MSMREGETLKTYSDRYWEMFNEIEEEHDDVAISTFKAGLPADHDLRKSLTGKPVTSVHQLMDRIDKYRRVEEDQLQGKGKAKVVNVVFREPMQQVLEKIKNEPFFKWLNKIAGEPKRRNPNLYCHYHQDHGHTTEDCRNLWDHLEQLVREGKLKQLLHHFSGRVSQAGSKMRGDASSRLPLSTINVIFVAPGRTGSCPSKVLSVFRPPAEDHCQASKRARVDVLLILGFSDEDKVGTIQPHDDALVVQLRIGGYDVKRVMIDQGSVVGIMYSDLYKELGLKPKNLTAYSSPLVSFEGRMVAPKGQIRLPVQAGMDVVEVDFIVVDVFSPYMTIMGRPWLHTLRTVSSTLHQKVKYPSGGQVLEIVGSQVATR
ncbi:uncharacterized protein LOC126700773 [Quercus robur]|uniref:uncharacterized protein LOC126700773 n=1 Tax=Quercus robur TaxID=38942 RepID=UPI002162D0D9|nr:uncharacterized protein LOC126700773 [Quercus robur]